MMAHRSQVHGQPLDFAHFAAGLIHRQGGHPPVMIARSMEAKENHAIAHATVVLHKPGPPALLAEQTPQVNKNEPTGSRLWNVLKFKPHVLKGTRRITPRRSES